jgi:HAE1 family hydrophobic/amphiphilic exporter-1
MAALSGGSAGLGWAAAIGVLLVVVVLAIQYEALLTPALILGVLPVSIVGAVVALYISETPLSATAFIGLILLIGIAANNAIVLVAFVEQLRRAGHSVVEAVRLGALLRLRPKLMTACVATAALCLWRTAGKRAARSCNHWPLSSSVVCQWRLLRR